MRLADLILLIFCLQFSKATVFVSPSGSDAASGERNNPLFSVQHAIAKAMQWEGAQASVVLLSGLYSKPEDRMIQVSVPSGSFLTIFGDLDAHSSIIDAQGDDFVFEFSGDGSIALANLTIKSASGCPLRTKGYLSLSVYAVEFLDNRNNNTDNGFPHRLSSERSASRYLSSTNRLQQQDNPLPPRDPPLEQLGGAVTLEEHSVASFDRCVFRRNSGASGGGVTISDSASASFSRCTFDANVAGSQIGGGGAVWVNSYGKGTGFYSCVFTENVAEDAGGAILATTTARFDVVDSSFFNNSANQAMTGGGGAFFGISCNVSFISTTFFGNVAQGSGGAVLLMTGAASRFTDCTFEENSVPYVSGTGGAIRLDAPKAFFESTDFIRNVASGGGGAVFIGNGGSGHWHHCVFQENSASKNDALGGAVTVTGLVASFDNVSFSQNSAGQGGAIATTNAGTVVVTGCEFVFNKAISPTRGGGATSFNSDGSTVSDSMFVNNTAAGAGGAVFIDSQGIVNFTRVNILSNHARDADRGGGAVFVASSTHCPSIFRRCIISDNYASGGGAFATSSVGAVWLLDKCELSRNTATNPAYGGGALWVRSSGLVAEDAVIASNTAIGSGGGLLAFGGAAIFRSVSFVNNSAQNANYGGGAAWLESPGYVFNQTEFFNNYAVGTGGGVVMAWGGAASFISCSFTYNMALVGGGAVSLRTSDTTFRSQFQMTSFSNNWSLGGGGAVFASTLGTGDWYNCTFVNNYTPQMGTTPHDGGAVLLQSGGSTFVGCSWIGNQAGGGGGAIATHADGEASFVESIFANNTALKEDAETGGGAMLLMGGLVSLRRAKFLYNTAPYGGAVFVSAATKLLSFASTCPSGPSGINPVFWNRQVSRWYKPPEYPALSPSSLYNANPPGKPNATAADYNNSNKPSDEGEDPPAPISHSFYDVLFTGNVATLGSGGAVNIGEASPSVVINAGEFFKNSALSGRGGAMYLSSKAPLQVLGSVFAGNSAREGKLLYAEAGTHASLNRSAACSPDPAVASSIACSKMDGGAMITGQLSYKGENFVDPSCNQTLTTSGMAPIDPNGGVQIIWGCLCAGRDQLLRTTPGLGPDVVSMTLSLSSSLTYPGVFTASLSQGSQVPIPDSATKSDISWVDTTSSSPSVPSRQLIVGLTETPKAFVTKGYYAFHISTDASDDSKTMCYSAAIQPRLRSVSVNQSSVGVVGTSILLTSQGYEVVLAIRDQFGDDFLAEWGEFMLETQGPDDKVLSCPQTAGARSNSFLCLFKPEVQGSYHFILRSTDELGNNVSNCIGKVVVVWVGWPIIGGCLGGLIMLFGIVFFSIRYVRRRKQREVDRMLKNYTRLSGVSIDEARNDLVERSLVVPFDDIEILRDVAVGATGKVMLGLWRKSRVAVKQFYGMVAHDTSLFVKESILHKGLRHPNVVQLLAITERPLCVVMEFMDRGTLYSNLQDADLDLPYVMRLRFSLEIARGMHYLHSCGLLHRDLKSLNIFINNDWHCKVGDFGASCNLASKLSAMKGTVLWSAPEVFSEDPEKAAYAQPADVYSFGIVLWEIYTRESPFNELNYGPGGWNIIQHIRQGGRPAIPEDTPEWYSALMKDCWDPDPNQRPDFAEIMRVVISAVHEEAKTNREFVAGTHRRTAPSAELVEPLLDELSSSGM